jgi:hypothetical protein
MKNFRKILRKSINETLEEKSEMLMKKIRKTEMEEGKDSPYIEGDDYHPSKFRKISNLRKHFSSDDEGGETPDYSEHKKRLKDLFKDIEGSGEDIEPISEGEMCECGSMMREGECMECGSMREEYLEEDDDYEGDEESMEDTVKKYCSRDYIKQNGMEPCETHKKWYEEDKGMIEERLQGNQRKLDKNKNNKIDAEDFKLLRKSKKHMTGKDKHKSEVEEDEMEEGNLFTKKLALARKGDKFTIGKKTYTDKSNYDGKKIKNEGIEYHIQDRFGDIIKLSESQTIDLIENIVNEQKRQGLKTIGKPKGLTTYEKAHRGSGKENDDYLKSVSKKMKDYVKDGSKGNYDMNPKFFPKGNGELGKMNKKAFQMTDELEDFNYEIAGQNFPYPDEIGYNEEWMDKLFKGDSMTGNAPGGNALESETNKRWNKMRKKNTLKKLKDQSYKRVPQPVFNETSTDKDGKLNLKLETMSEKKVNMLKEEFDRMKDLFKYNRKTQ